MKNKLKLLIIIIFLGFCFIIFYKGLNNSNTYSPKINDKKNIPTFEAKIFNLDGHLNSKKFLKKIFSIL